MGTGASAAVTAAVGALNEEEMRAAVQGFTPRTADKVATVLNKPVSTQETIPEEAPPPPVEEAPKAEKQAEEEAPKAAPPTEAPKAKKPMTEERLKELEKKWDAFNAEKEKTFVLSIFKMWNENKASKEAATEEPAAEEALQEEAPPAVEVKA